jgi:hypothetical protein
LLHGDLHCGAAIRAGATGPSLTVPPARAMHGLLWKLRLNSCACSSPQPIGDESMAGAWVGGWDKCHVLFVVMVERPRPVR